MKMFLGFLETARFGRSLTVGVFLSLFSWSAAYGTGVFLFLLFSFAFNDLIDAPKDAIGHPGRAIPSGKITRRHSLLLSLLLLVLGLWWSFIVLKQYAGGFLAAYAFSILYSLVLKPNVPILGTPVWSAAVAIVFVQPFTDVSAAYFGVGSIVYAYELLLDHRDRDADRKFCKTPTLAHLLGKGTYALSGLVFLIGLALLAKAAT